MVRRLRPFACCVIAFPLAAAVPHDDLNDLRGYIGFPPSYEVDAGPHHDVDVDAGPRIGVQHVRNFTDIDDRVGGWFWGVEGSVTPFDDHDIDGFVLLADGMVGYAYRLPPQPHVHFEGAPFVGLGFTDRDGGDDDGFDLYAEFGLRAAAFWTFDSGWQAGFELRLLRGQGGDQDQDGVMPSFLGGYRF